MKYTIERSATITSITSDRVIMEISKSVNGGYVVFMYCRHTELPACILGYFATVSMAQQKCEKLIEFIG